MFQESSDIRELLPYFRATFALPFLIRWQKVRLRKSNSSTNKGNGCDSLKKYMDLEDMSQANCASVLRVIQAHSGISRKQIADMTGLSWGGMTKIVNKLFEHEYIVEEKNGVPGGFGRTPGLLSLNREKHFAAGADINKTGLSASVTDLLGGIRRQYFAENIFGDKEGLLCNISHFFEKIFQDFPEGEIEAVGIAMQGGIDAKQGISVSFPGCRDWMDVPIVHILKEKFRTEIDLEHDPDCMLYCELEHVDANHVILLRLDRSIGMAAALNGTILRAKGILEVAHCTVVPGGKACRCGRSGCLEAYIAPCLKDGKIQKAAVGEMIAPLAAAIHNLICIFNADTVILAGELMRYSSLFEGRLRLEIQKLQGERKTEIIFTDGAGSAVTGAALIASSRAVERIKL